MNNPRLRHIEEERLRAEAEAKAKAEAEARKKAEAERKRRAEEARRKAEEEAKLKAEEEARKAAEAEAERKKAEAARKRRETIARKKAEEEAARRREAEAEEARRRAEAERIRREEELRRQREEEARIKAMTPKQRKRYFKEKARIEKAEYRKKNAEKIRQARQRLKKRIGAIACVAAVAVVAIIVTPIIIRKCVTEPREKYESAEALFAEMKYSEALEVFKTLGGRADSENYVAYCEAMLLHGSGESARAALMLGKLDFLDSYSKSKEIFWSKTEENVTVAQGYDFYVGINADGSVRYRYKPDDGQAPIEGAKALENAVSVAAGTYHAVALREDGRVEVIIEGSERKATKGVDKWENVVRVYCYRHMTVGIKADGTVLVANAEPSEAVKSASKWTDIVSLSVGSTYYFENNGIGDQINVFTVVGATVEGKVVIVSDGNESSIMEKSSQWTDIKSVSLMQVKNVSTHLVGLKSDGTAVACGTDRGGMINVGTWHDLVSVRAVSDYSLGLKNDGTVCVTGSGVWTTIDASNMSNVASLVAADTLIGVTKDGRIVCPEGVNCFVSDWTGLKAR
jgi:hypothetical protein